MINYSAMELFEIGSAQLWHSNMALSHSGDRIDAHCGRRARLLSAWHPDPDVSLVMAVVIDDRDLLKTDDDERWFNFVAGTDCVMWMLLKAPWLLKVEAKWTTIISDLLKDACDLGVEQEFTYTLWEVHRHGPGGQSSFILQSCLGVVK